MIEKLYSTKEAARIPAVKQRTGLSRSTIYLRIAQGTFPAPVSLGARAVGWVESEVDERLARRIAESRRLQQLQQVKTMAP